MTKDFNYYYEQYGELYLKQLELEADYKQRAENILQANIDKAVADSEASKTKVGSKIIAHIWDDISQEMSKLLETISNPKRGVVPAYTIQLKELMAIYVNKQAELVNLMTMATCSTLLNACFIPKNSSISKVASEITKVILQEANLEKFILEEGAKGEDIEKETNVLRTSVLKGINKRVRSSYRVAYISARMRAVDYTGELKWSKEACQRLGAKLLEIGVKASGCFELVERSYEDFLVKRDYKGNKSMLSVVPSEWLEKTWKHNTDLMSKYAHSFIPTIIPPKKWDSPYGGGYYGAFQGFANIIRKDTNSSIFAKEYKQKLEQVDLTFIYKALNALQETPFKINKEILEVSEKIIATGGNLGGFPQTEPYEMLPQLPEPYTEEELREHKKKQVAIIKRNQRRQSKALRALMAVGTAKRFKDYERIYFPHNMDYRGRCYPIPTSLSPQGDDITKALLVFAEPAPCKNEDDWKWLAIHGANLAGHDKISFAERIQWVEDNTLNIIASAEDPLGYTWWSKEAENDYPMEFLSFCFEWKRFKEWMSQHGTCVNFKSNIPIAFDGTCSGLQHFSALLRDEIGGHAVNLTPTDRVQDIYSIVAEKVNKVLTKDAISGNGDDYKKDKKSGEYILDFEGNKQIKYGTKTLAQQWLVYARDKFGTEGITRKVCKRSVMTLAYGSGLYGFKENLLEDIIKPYVQAHPDTHPFLSPTQSAVYMADLIWNAVSTTVVKAVEGMKYLQQIAKLICKGSHVVTWTTPNGLPVQQEYMKVKQVTFQMRINGDRHRFYSQETTGDIDGKGQAQGIAPNYIHSMDACHLQRVVVASKEAGNSNFAMIHDSFGTDVAHAGELFRIIREQFVKLYDNQDHLQNFLDDVKYLIDTNEKLPEHPKFGNLEVKEVLNSDFCFA